jgi:hypothetical protein
MKIVSSLLGLLLVFTSCKTNPPTTFFLPGEQVGKILITANVDSAGIFVNNTFTGKYTPDTVALPFGEYTIKVIKEVEPKTVLLEDFANVSCVPCVISNKIIENLTRHTYGTSKLIAVKFPTNFPAPNDPFYLANKPDCDSRISYYNVFFAPNTVIDGIERPISTDSLDIKASVDLRLSDLPRFSLNIKDSISSADYFIDVNVKVIPKYFPQSKTVNVNTTNSISVNFELDLETSPINFDDLVLHTVVTETEIEFATPPGSNGETKFYDVMRKMLPSNAGESLSTLGITGEGSFSRQIPVSPAWNSNNLNAVVYIQNKSTKEVLQAGSTLLLKVFNQLSF